MAARSRPVNYLHRPVPGEARRTGLRVRLAVDTGPGVFQGGFAALDEQGLRDARQDVEGELLQFRASDGRYLLPAEYRLFWGMR